MDINTYSKDNWEKLKEAAELAIQMEPDPDKKADMEDELADLADDIAEHFMANGYDFPELPADFEDLLKQAEKDVAKQKRLQEIFDNSIEMAGQAVNLTRKVTGFLGKYGKYLALI
ncbi:MAG: hypothetical protein GTN81_03750 [Proteobacteria bacterium]|nr:hypothetical protein [Pseudomonadota bacterium]